MDSETLDITEARNQFNKLDERLRDEQVIRITRHNKPVFAVVDIEYLKVLLETIEIMSDPTSFEHFQKGLKDMKEGRVHDHDDVKRRLGRSWPTP